MRIHSISAEGLWLFREKVEVDVSNDALLVAVGSNGAGKSSLFVSAVVAALYGRVPSRTTDESITQGSSQGTANVTFAVHGNLYRVTRVFTRKRATSASVEADVNGVWQPLTHKGVMEVNQKVIDLIGMDYETAAMTWLAEQGRYGRFAQSDPAARFKLLSTVFGLDKYKDMLATAQETLKSARSQVDVWDGRVTELLDSMVREDEVALEEEDALEVELAGAVESYEAAHAVIAAPEHVYRALKAGRLERLDEARRTLDSLTAAQRSAVAHNAAELRRLSDSIAQHVRALANERQRAFTRLDAERTYAWSIAARRVELERRRIDVLANEENAKRAVVVAGENLHAFQELQSTAEATRAEALRLIEEHETRGAALQDDLDAIQHGEECSTCHQALSPATRESLVASLTAAIAAEDDSLQSAQEAERVAHREHLALDLAIDTAEDNVNAAASNLTRASLELRDVDLQLAALVARDVADIEREITALDEEYAENVKNAKAGHEERTTELSARHEQEEHEHAERLQDAASRVQALSVPTAEEESAQQALSDAQANAGDVEDARARVRDVTERLDRVREAKRRAQETSDRAETAKAKLAEARLEVEVYAALVAAYSPSGIPSMMLESVIDGLSAAVNETLRDLSDGTLAVQLTTARETASGKTESKVTVYVDTPTGTQAYESLSGGQKFRVDLAIRMGLTRIVTQSTGTPIDTFVLDEGWGVLDSDGIRHTLSVLHKLSETVNVLTVSHVESVRDAFPAAVIVESTNGAASVRRA